MSGDPPSSLGAHLALALAAGAIATKRDGVASAIRDRHAALRRAVARRSAEISLGDLDGDPGAEEQRAALARALEEHGALRDGDVVTIAKELLALLKMDDAALDALGAMTKDVEEALVALTEVDVEDREAPKAERAERTSTRDVSSRADLRPPTTSRRLVPPDEPSKTELERSALPVWKRTDRFFTKTLILVGVYVVLGVVVWLALRRPPNEAMERCVGGDRARCWEVVTAEDGVDVGRRVSREPLRLLCEQHHDACGCAGLAYADAVDGQRTADCADLSRASAIDPRWPCTCRRYEFWRRGEPRLSTCGVPRCE